MSRAFIFKGLVRIVTDCQRPTFNFEPWCYLYEVCTFSVVRVTSRGSSNLSHPNDQLVGRLIGYGTSIG